MSSFWECFCRDCHKMVFPSCDEHGPIVDMAWCSTCITEVPFTTVYLPGLSLEEDAGRGLETPRWDPELEEQTRARSNAFDKEDDFDYRAASPLPTYLDPYDMLNRVDSTGLPPAVIDLTHAEDAGDITQTDFDALRKKAGDKRKSPHAKNDPARAWAGTWYLWKTEEEFDKMWERSEATRLPKACDDDPIFKRFWTNSSISYAIIGKERCPTTNRLHLQITIYAKNKLRFSTLQNLAPGCRWTPCYKPLQANINYCRKEKDWIEHGCRPLTKQEGALARLQLAHDFMSHPLRTLEEYDLIFDQCKALLGEAMDLVCDVMVYTNNKY